MKKPTSFRLSDEALNALQDLATRFEKSQAEVLEFLILDRHSVSDRKKSAARREWTIMNHKEEWEGKSLEQVYRRGYRDAWLHFQTRHGDNEFIIDLPDKWIDSS